MEGVLRLYLLCIQEKTEGNKKQRCNQGEAALFGTNAQA